MAAYLAGIRSDDPNRAYRAADAWISRVHGRPRETVENVTAFDDPLDVASMSREQRDALKRQILRQHTRSSQSSTACAASGKPEGRATACAATATGKATRTPATISHCAGPKFGQNQS